jgi:hypothetical protein
MIIDRMERLDGRQRSRAAQDGRGHLQGKFAKAAMNEK